MIACIDDAIGGVLHALDGTRRGGDTVVMFTSDHGDHLGDHRLMLKGAEQYQSIVRVPFIWSDPQAADAAGVADTLASTLDISATVLERAGIEPFSGMQGKSVLPALDGATAVRDSVFIQYDHQHPSPGTDLPPRVHTLIDRRYRLSVFHGTGWGELYDLESDPGEFENLWEDPARLVPRAHGRATAHSGDRICRPRAAADAPRVMQRISLTFIWVRPPSLPELIRQANPLNECFFDGCPSKA